MGDAPALWLTPKTNARKHSLTCGKIHPERNTKHLNEVLPKPDLAHYCP